MTRTTRWHLDTQTDADELPSYLSKQQFGQRLMRMIMEKGWNQSELARRSGLPRDSISTYVRGKVRPTPKSLRAMASALGVKPEDIYPNILGDAIGADEPSMEMKVSVSDPTRAWLRVNRLVTVATASKIMSLLAEDRSHDDRDADAR